MFDVAEIIRAAGLIGVTAIVFAESGLLIGFFLPGDSLLFTAGILASQGYMSIVALCVSTWIAAVVGDGVGYAFGKKVGPAIFTRDDSFLFKKSHIQKSEAFFEKYGAKAIVIARFVPVVRTFTPILAGVGSMRYRTFLAYNLIGASLWAVGISLLGYFLGNAVHDIERYIVPGAVLIIIVSFIPAIREVWKDPDARAKIKGYFGKKNTG